MRTNRPVAVKVSLTLTLVITVVLWPSVGGMAALIVPCGEIRRDVDLTAGGEAVDDSGILPSTGVRALVAGVEDLISVLVMPPLQVYLDVEAGFVLVGEASDDVTVIVGASNGRCLGCGGRGSCHPRPRTSNNTGSRVRNARPMVRMAASFRSK
jgi:hypothetical protein